MLAMISFLVGYQKAQFQQPARAGQKRELVVAAAWWSSLIAVFDAAASRVPDADCTVTPQAEPKRAKSNVYENRVADLLRAII
jgi:hypothetical protein